MHDNELNFLSLYDGTCDQTKELVTLSGIMSLSTDEKWVMSSSGHHMFVSLTLDYSNSIPGFTSKIHHGNEINDIKNA